MAYKDFTILDYIAYSVAVSLDKPIRDNIKKAGATDKQIDISGAILVYFFAKTILSDYIKGKKLSYAYELFDYSVFSLKQFILAINDSNIKNKTSVFLRCPSIENAQNVIDELSKSEQRYFSQEAIDDFYKDKQMMENMNGN